MQDKTQNKYNGNELPKVLEILETSVFMTKQEYFEILARELVWGILYDDCTVDQWYKLLRSLEENKLWANGNHRGDCTRDAMSCHRCIFEEVDKFSKPIVAAFLKVSGNQTKDKNDRA